MRFVLAALSSFVVMSAALAQDARWTLVQSIGEVSVEEAGLSRIAVKPNAKLNEGATVTTGPNGRAVLTDGRSSISVSANSRLELPAAGGEDMTSIRQDFGTAVFKVQKKPTAHFEVQTPYLAAVVKGTTFEVSVDAMGATVDVEEGLVDVGSALSGERTLVPGGQRVRVLRSGRFDGGRPEGLDRGTRTTAALNVIDVEIPPESNAANAEGQEIAALDPASHASPRTDTFDAKRDRDDGAPAQAAETDGDGPSAAPRAPEPTAPSSGEGATPPSEETTDNDRDGDRDFDFDRSRYASFLEKLKQAYGDWRSRRDGDDDHRHD